MTYDKEEMPPQLATQTPPRWPQGSPPDMIRLNGTLRAESRLPLNQKELTKLRDAMIDRAAQAISRSDALLERTRQVLHHAETLAAKDEAAPPAPKVMK